MPTLRQVRGRISGVRKTQKITKAMKMVATARLRRAQSAVLAARPYAERLRQLLADLASSAETRAELFAEREVRSVAFLVVTSDRGLCGAFNTNLARAVIQHAERTYPGWKEEGRLKLFCIGRKGYDILSRRDFTILERQIGLFAELAFSSAKHIAEMLLGGYGRGDFDRVEIFYNRFQSAGRSVIAIDRYLPIPPEAADAAQRRREYIYEPSQQEILRGLIPRYLDFVIWRVLLESNAAEQGARMAAMENATENASELIEALQLQYNKARQASITKELLEVVGGADALRQSD